eukprot:TRINITY_DN9438_c0_g1_i2.p1 TRINITY_DN9438_c0_g1~~TRINITY_DN9438_c0_g1_i2.p1  ORF type:complete len:303 (+),score=100.14 TRINITY_DN9438_c0_g1_i2:347-1255(+)
MGVPKQKWTNEEEAALRAGVEKYGPGKWRAILKDPVLSTRLAIRSNVDLKDKWRNMSVTANGWGSREKARLALKRSKHLTKQSGRHLVLSTLNNGNNDNSIVDAKPVSVINTCMQSSNLRTTGSRLERLIFDALSSLKEPNGSSKSTIAAYIEENYRAPANFRRLLSTKLRSLASSGRLSKIRQNYKLGSAVSSAIEDDVKSEEDGKVDLAVINSLSKKEEEEAATECIHDISGAAEKRRKMNAEEAAKTAALAVVEAEVAIAAAEKAAHELEAAEAEAVAAELFAEAAKSAMMALTNSRSC